MNEVWDLLIKETDLPRSGVVQVEAPTGDLHADVMRLVADANDADFRRHVAGESLGTTDERRAEIVEWLNTPDALSTAHRRGV